MISTFWVLIKILGEREIYHRKTSPSPAAPSPAWYPRHQKDKCWRGPWGSASKRNRWRFQVLLCVTPGSNPRLLSFFFGYFSRYLADFAWSSPFRKWSWPILHSIRALSQWSLAVSPISTLSLRLTTRFEGYSEGVDLGNRLSIPLQRHRIIQMTTPVGEHGLFCGLWAACCRALIPWRRRNIVGGGGHDSSIGNDACSRDCLL